MGRAITHGWLTYHLIAVSAGMTRQATERRSDRKFGTDDSLVAADHALPRHLLNHLFRA